MKLRTARDAMHHVNTSGRFIATEPKPVYRDGAGRLIGWTFRAGPANTNAYGWVLTTGETSAGQLNGRTEAATEARLNAAMEGR